MRLGSVLMLLFACNKAPAEADTADVFTGAPSGVTTWTSPGDFSLSIDWTDDGVSPTDTDGDGLPDTGCGDTVTIYLFDPLQGPSWIMGMAQSGSNGWTGEDCLSGYDSYSFCHPIGIPSHTLIQVENCRADAVVAGVTTLLHAELDPELTYYLDDSAGFCLTFGDNVAYYASLGCTEMQ